MTKVQRAGPEDSPGAGVPDLGLAFGELPSLFHSADAVAQRAQRSFLHLVRVRLALLIFAGSVGLFGIVSGMERAAGLVAAVAFTVLALMHVAVRLSRVQTTWYEARAVAESAKTLAWRYAVRAAPFVQDDRVDDKLLLQRLREVVGDTSIPPPRNEHGGEQITLAMRALRCEPIDVRKRAFDHGRLRDQLAWYSAKAMANKRAALRWDIVFLALVGVSIVAGMLVVVGATNLNVTGLAATLTAAVMTWIGVRDYATLARAYGVAALELTLIRELLGGVESQEAWSRFVADAEEAISREHTFWRASRA